MTDKKKDNPGFILVVEDEISINTLVVGRLASLGLEIRSAYSAKEAVEVLRNDKPELMLLDYTLPDMSALELLAELKKNKMAVPPFIVVTGNGNESLAVELMKAGAEDYLIKDTAMLDNLPGCVKKALAGAERRRNEKQAADLIKDRRADSSPRPVLRRLLPPLAGMVGLLLAGAAALLYHQHRQQLINEIAADISDVSLDLSAALESQPDASGGAARKAPRGPGAAALMDAWRPVFFALLNRPGNRLLVVIHKEYLDQRDREDSLRGPWRQADRERLPLSVVLYTSQGRLPDALVSWAGLEHAHRQAGRTFAFGGKDWRVSAVPLTGPSGKEVGDLLVMHDITADEAAFKRLLAYGGAAAAALLVLLLGFIYVLLRRTDAGIRAQQAALRESEELFGSFMEHSPAYVFFKDENIRTVRLSRNFETMLGRPMAELIGKTMEDLFPPELAKVMTAEDTRVLKEGKKVNIEEELYGRFYSTIKFPIRLEGKQPYLAGFSTDITERKQAEEALRQSEERYRILFNRANDGIVVISLNGELVSVNESFARMHGYSPKEMLHMSLKDLDASQASPTVSMRMRRLLAGEAQTFEIRHYHKSGHTFPIEVSANVISFGKETFIQFFHRDITERKQAEEALRLQAEELQARNSELSRFNMVTIGRELRMIELKREVNELCGKAGEPPRHRIPEEEAAPPPEQGRDPGRLL